MTEVTITNREPTDDELTELLSTGIVESVERESGEVLILLDTGEAVRLKVEGGGVVAQIGEVA